MAMINNANTPTANATVTESNKLTPSQNTKPGRRRKRVSFFQANGNDDDKIKVNEPVSSIITTTAPASATDDDDMKINKSDMWYLVNDLQNCKVNAKLLAKKTSETYKSLLNDTFVTLSFQQSNNVFDDDNNNDPLIAWCQIANARRGIEQWVNKDQGKYRQRRRRALIASVLSRQNMIRNRRPRNNANNANSKLMEEQQLAELSMQHSYDSKLYSRRMGIADEKYVVNINKNNKIMNDDNVDSMIPTITMKRTMATATLLSSSPSSVLDVNNHLTLKYDERYDSSSTPTGIPSNLLLQNKHISGIAA